MGNDAGGAHENTHEQDRSSPNMCEKGDDRFVQGAHVPPQDARDVERRALHEKTKRRRPSAFVMGGVAASVCAVVLICFLCFNVFLPRTGQSAEGSDRLNPQDSFADTMAVVPSAQLNAQQDSVDALSSVLHIRDGENDALTLADLPEGSYTGFLFALSDSADSAAGLSQKMADACNSGLISPVHDNTYSCASLDVLAGLLDTSQLSYVEPNYTMKLLDESEQDVSADKVSVLDDGSMSELGGTATNPAPDYPPTDPQYENGLLWNLDMLNVSGAWSQGLDGDPFVYGGSAVRDSNVKVAVIDTGLYGTGTAEEQHEDIDYTHVTDATNFATLEEGAPDAKGHGTFVTGLIAAKVDNGKGIAGIMPSVDIVPVKVFGTSDASTDDVVKGVYYAVDEAHVDVINMSLGGTYNSDTLKEACDYATEQGVLVVASAGNDGVSTPNYPAAYESVVGVASVDKNGMRSTWSQYGVGVFVTAPGEDVTSTYFGASNKYATGSGTSFSGPEVAALGAMCKSVYPDINQDTFKEFLIQTSTDYGETGYDDFYGWGLVDFGKMATTVLESQVLPSYHLTFNVMDEGGNAVTGSAIDLYAAEDIVWEADPEHGIPTAGTISAGTLIAADPDGTYTLHRGKYRYTVSKDGYYTADGTLKTYSANQTADVTLLQGYETVLTLQSAQGAPLTSLHFAVKSASGRTETPKLVAGNVQTFDLASGTYTFEAGALSHETVSGSFTVQRADKQMDIVLYGASQLSAVTFDPTDSESHAALDNVGVVVRTADGVSIDADSDGVFHLARGVVYDVVGSRLGYEDSRTQVTIADIDNQSFELPMVAAECQVTFKPVDEKGNAVKDATLHVVDSSGVERPSSANDPFRYNLKEGSYTYTFSAPGYSNASASFSVATESRTLTVVMKGIPSTVSFNVTDADTLAVITGASVKVSTNVSLAALPANDDGTYTLAPGDYRYTVYKQGYEVSYGSFSVPADSVVNVPLQPKSSGGVTYEGGSGTAEDPYLIANEAQLRYLADQTEIVRSSSTDAPTNKHEAVEGYYQLVSDIELTGDWQPIGNSENSSNYVSFSGTFDGAGHTVSGLKMNNHEWNCQGLFGYVSGAHISNLTVKGAVSGKSYVGGIVGQVSFYESDEYTDWNTGKTLIEDCASYVDVVGHYAVGGIVGSASGQSYSEAGSTEVVYGTEISECCNFGSVTASVDGQFTKSDHAAGGIVGSGRSTKVSYCYNQGTVQAGYCAAGIVAMPSTAQVSNCYNAGYLASYQPGTGYAGMSGSIVGYSYATAVSASYGLVTDNVDAAAVGGNHDSTTTFTRCAMKPYEAMFRNADFLTDVNTDAATDVVRTTYVKGNDFPLLYWQVAPDAVLAETPRVIVQPTGNEGETAYVQGDTAAELKAEVDAIGDGGVLTWAWFVSDDKDATNGTAVPGATGTGTQATMVPGTATAGVKYYYAVFTNTLSENGVEGTAEATTKTAGIVVRSNVDALPPTIDKLNPNQGSDMNTQVSAKVTTDLELVVEASSPDGGDLSYQWYKSAIAQGSGTAIEGAQESTYMADTSSEGTVYYYVEVTNTTEEGNSAVTLSDWVKATVTPYTIETYEELCSFRTAVNAGESFNGYTVELKNDIAIPSGVDWEPIGTSEHPFSGTFAGGRGVEYSAVIEVHTISNLHIDGDAQGNTKLGLFGVSQYGYFYDVQVEGTITGATNTHTGLLVGQCLTDASGSYPCHIVNCATVEGSSVEGKYYVGGLVGYGNSDFIECANHADVTGRAYTPDATDKSLNNNSTRRSMMGVGGIAGMLGTGNMMGCYNTGAIEVEAIPDSSGQWTAISAGGLTGYVSSFGAIGSCFDTGTLTIGTEAQTTYQAGTRYAGAVAGYVTYDNLRNLHYLDGAYKRGNSGSSGYDSSENHTIAFMKTGYFTDMMNDGTYALDFVTSTNGAPHLKWETDTTLADGIIDAAEPYIIDVAMKDQNITSTWEASFYQGEEIPPLIVVAQSPDGGVLTYVWQQRDEGEGDDAWVNVAGATGTVPTTGENADKIFFNPPSDTVSATEYRCVITNTLAGATGRTSLDNEIPAVLIEVLPDPGLFSLRDPDQPNSESNPWVIDTAKQMAFLAQIVNGTAKMTTVTDPTFADQYLSLEADVDLTECGNWVPIGKEGHRFEGCFDGNNHAVSNMTLIRTASDSSERCSNCGLFGSTEAAIVRNLSVSGMVSVQSEYAWNTAGVVGYGYGTQVENVVSNVDVEGFNVIGGIIARAISSRAVDCENAGDISITTAVSVTKDWYGYDVGGIVGYSSNTFGLEKAGVFTCFNGGKVSGRMADDEHSFGAIMGRRDNEKVAIEHCYYREGSVVCVNNAAKSSGGVGSKASDPLADADGFVVGVEDANDPHIAWALNTADDTAAHSARWGNYTKAAFGDTSAHTHLVIGDSSKVTYRVDPASEAADIIVSSEYPAPGSPVSVSWANKDGYTVTGVSYQVDGEATTHALTQGASFTMPSADVSFVVDFTQDSSFKYNLHSAVVYEGAPAAADKGTVTLDATKAHAGDTVNVHITVGAGYQVKSLVAKGQYGTDAPLTRIDGSNYSFTMLTEEVTVTLTLEDEGSPAATRAPSLPVTDDAFHINATDEKYQTPALMYETITLSGDGFGYEKPYMTYELEGLSSTGKYEQVYTSADGSAHRYTGFPLSDYLDMMGLSNMQPDTPVRFESTDGSVFTCTWGDLTALNRNSYDADSGMADVRGLPAMLAFGVDGAPNLNGAADIVFGQTSASDTLGGVVLHDVSRIAVGDNINYSQHVYAPYNDMTAIGGATDIHIRIYKGDVLDSEKVVSLKDIEAYANADIAGVQRGNYTTVIYDDKEEVSGGPFTDYYEGYDLYSVLENAGVPYIPSAKVQFYQTAEWGLDNSWKTVNVSLAYLAGNGPNGFGDFSNNVVSYGQTDPGSGDDIVGVRPVFTYGKNGLPLVYYSGSPGVSSTAYNYRGPIAALLPENAVEGGSFVGNQTALACYLGLIDVKLPADAKPVSRIAWGSDATATATDTTVTVTPAKVISGDGAVSYCISTTNAMPADSAAWQTGTTFSGLNPETPYYVFARIAATANYEGASASGSLSTETKATGSVPSDSFTVRFDTKGGSATVPNQVVKKNKFATRPADPQRSGYTFQGWFTSTDGGATLASSPFAFSTTPIVANLTLYAKWTPVPPVSKVTLTYASAGNGTVKVTGSNPPATSESILPTATAAGATATPASGYHFVKWTNAANASVSTSAAFVPTKPAGGYATTTYTAHFAANTYTVKFDANDASATGTMSDMSVAFGESKTVPANAFTLANNDFQGWNTKADGSGTAYAQGDAIGSLAVTNGATVTLYAQWKATSTPPAPPVSKVTLTYASAGNGTVAVTGSNPSATTESILPTAKAAGATATADDGYHFVNWTDGAGAVVSTAPAFVPTAPAGGYAAATYTAHFAIDEVSDPTFGFTDVINDLAANNGDVWYVSDGWLSYVVEHGLMTGYTDGSNNFGIYDPITRGQVATILYRYDQNKTADTTDNNVNAPYPDVAAGAYYAAAVDWCSQQGIVTGYLSGDMAGTFQPEKPVTREELALMLARYVGWKQTGEAVPPAADNQAYLALEGADQVDDWAQAGVAYCCDKKILTGVDGYKLAPRDEAWRTAMAKMVTVVTRDII